MMAEDATPLVEALVSIIDAARAYLPPDGIGKDAFITKVLEAALEHKVNIHTWTSATALPPICV